MFKIVQLSDGNMFAGEFNENGHRHGIGTKYYKNGATFKGIYVNDVRHGKGVKTTSTGVKKEVEYYNGELV